MLKIIIFLFVLFANMFAMDFYIHENNSKTLNAILGKGIIEYSDVEKLDNFLKNLPRKKHTAIYLDSPGGNLMGGIRLGKYFKDNRIKTVIQGYKVCASACALAFLGGTDYKGNKWMSSTTKSLLGFHAFYNADGTKYANTDDIQQTVALVLKYGKYVQAPINLLIKAFSTPSNKMYWLSTQEELKFGIKVWDIDNNRFLKNYNGIRDNFNKSFFKNKKAISLKYSKVNKLINKGNYIASYTAKLAKVDHYNSRGVRLYNAAAIIRQDRFNYHIRGIMQKADTWDPFFNEKYNREVLENMLSKGTARKGALKKIIYGTPLIKVDIYKDHINVKVIDVNNLSRIE